MDEHQEIMRENAEHQADMFKAMLIEASRRQGGHSKRGGEIADALGIPFPLNMRNLERRAKEMGFDPNELWPWLAPMRAGKTNRLKRAGNHANRVSRPRR